MRRATPLPIWQQATVLTLVYLLGAAATEFGGGMWAIAVGGIGWIALGIYNMGRIRSTSKPTDGQTELNQ